MRKVGSDYLITRGSLILFVLSYAAIAVALVWLAAINNKIADEHGQRLTQDTEILKVDCQRENDTRAALRRVLTFAEASTLGNPRIGADERVQAEKFYTQALKLVPPVNC